MMQPSVIRPAYNEANLLERVDANLRGAEENGQPIWTPFVININYDAKGQRQRIDYGNGVRTTYQYDPFTFRLTHLYSRRGTAFNEDCENPQPPPPTIAAPDVPTPGTPCGLQNLHYTYDPAGNITHIRDDAHQTIYFRNKRVEPSNDYTYDAIYRLIEATGREHLAQIPGAPVPHSHNDVPRVGIDWSANDGNAMGTYIERYVYDAVGNFLEMQHLGSDPVHPGWTRRYAYNETSLIENGIDEAPLKTSNRLSSTAVGNNNPPLERYVHDAHGNMIRMPHLGGAHPDRNMHWDYRDQLRKAELGGGGTAYYVYDAAGQRARKVWEKSANLIEERIYLGAFEIFRRRQGTERLERETLHLMDDQQRIALVETRTVDTTGGDPAPAQLTRYQLGNHLGSGSLELDDQAEIISYEEYTPYGSSSYQAVRSQTGTPKRYRYTGKERDEESGLYYHGARYDAPWLGRWVSADPAGVKSSLTLYDYVSASPLILVDPDGRSPQQISPGGPAGPGFDISNLLEEIFEATFHPKMDEIKAVPDIFDIEPTPPPSTPNPPAKIASVPAPTRPPQSVQTAPRGSPRQPSLSGPKTLPEAPPASGTPFGFLFYLEISLTLEDDCGGCTKRWSETEGVEREPELQWSWKADESWEEGSGPGTVPDPSQLDFVEETSDPQDEGELPVFPLHHVFPQEFRREFEALDIDIDIWALAIDPAIHGMIHAGGSYGGETFAPYNDQWGEFFNENPDPTPEQVMEFATEMMWDQGLTGPDEIPNWLCYPASGGQYK
jgi:RHS repeat-associated protein